MVPVVLKALEYDERRGSYSVGECESSHVEVSSRMSIHVYMHVLIYMYVYIPYFPEYKLMQRLTPKSLQVLFYYLSIP